LKVDGAVEASSSGEGFCFLLFQTILAIAQTQTQSLGGKFSNFSRLTMRSDASMEKTGRVNCGQQIELGVALQPIKYQYHSSSCHNLSARVRPLHRTEEDGDMPRDDKAPHVRRGFLSASVDIWKSEWIPARAAFSFFFQPSDDDE
jgi:hypothetical protein